MLLCWEKNPIIKNNIVLNRYSFFLVIRYRPKDIACIKENKNNVSGSQTVILSGQLEKMDESNRIQTEYLELFGKYISAAQESVELQKEQKELDDKKRKTEIKPRIKKDGGTSSSNQSTLHIKNVGGNAKIIDVSRGPTNTVALSGFELMKGKDLEPGIRNSISMTTSSNCIHMNSCIVDIILILEDEDNNNY